MGMHSFDLIQSLFGEIMESRRFEIARFNRKSNLIALIKQAAN